MKIEIKIPGVILFKEDVQFNLSYAFMRLQEFYESVDVSRQGKYFSLDEVIEHSAFHEERIGTFDYLTRWAGFNVPGPVVDKFIELYKHDFTNLEKKLFNKLQQVLDTEDAARTDAGEYYIIGTCSDIYIDHEICHALWYLYPEFKKNSKAIINKFPKSYITAVHKMLKETGYADNVLEDEFNAYIATSDMYYIKETCLEHLPDAQRKTIKWDKIYELVENYWIFKEDNQQEDEDVEIKL